MSRREYATSVDADWETFAFYPLMNNLLDVSGYGNHGRVKDSPFNDPYNQGRNSLYCHDSAFCLEVPTEVLSIIRSNVGKGIRLSGHFIKNSIYASANDYPNLFDFGHSGSAQGYNVQFSGGAWLIGIANQSPTFPVIRIPKENLPTNTPLYFEHTLIKNMMQFILKQGSIVLVDETVTGNDIILNAVANYLTFGACPYFQNRSLRGNIWDCKIELHI